MSASDPRLLEEVGDLVPLITVPILILPSTDAHQGTLLILEHRIENSCCGD